MGTTDVIHISRNGGFSLEEARQLLPLIRKITEDHRMEVDALIARLEALEATASESISKLESQINSRIKSWQNKVRKLGAVPKGLWLVDFDSGDGYFCWKFPEPDILYWHSYTDGFTKRVHVDIKGRNP